MDTIGDPSALPAHADAFGDAVRKAGDAPLLRSVFVEAPGHCTFSAAEYLSALRTLEHRLDTGRWANAATPRVMNAVADASGLPGPSRFIHYKPETFLRPCPAGEECPGQP